MINQEISQQSEEHNSEWNNFKLNLEQLHPEIAMKKEKIFSKSEFSKRKTKIICTLG